MRFEEMYDFSVWANKRYNAGYSEKDVAILAYELTEEIEYCKKMSRVTKRMRELVKILFNTSGAEAEKWNIRFVSELTDWSDGGVL